MHSAPGTCLAFDGKGRLYSGGYDGKVIAWDTDYRKMRWHASHSELVNSIAVFGSTVLTASADRTVHIWDAETGKDQGILISGHRDDINTVRVSEEYGVVAVSGEEGALWIYDLAGNRLWKRNGGVEGHDADCIDGIDFIRRSGEVLIAAGDTEGYLSVYNLSGELQFRESIGGTTECAVADKSGRFLFLGLDDGRIVMFDAESAELHVIKPHTSAVKAIVTSHSERRLVSTSYDGDMAITSYPELIEVERLHISSGVHIGWSRGLAIHPRDASCLIGTSLGSAPQVWNLAERCLALPEANPTRGVNAISCKGELVYCGGDDGNVWVVEAGLSSVLAPLGSMINGLATHPTQGKIATACQDGKCTVINLETARVVNRLPTIGAPATCCAWSENASFLAIGYYNGVVRIVDETGNIFSGYIEVRGPDTVKSVTFVDDNTLAIGGADGHLQLRSALDGKLIAHRSGMYLINSVSWSSKKQQIITVGRDLYARQWDRTLNLLEERRCHTRSVKGVVWHPSGNKFATCSYDATVGFHDIGGSEVIYGAGHARPGVPCVSWLNESTLVSGGWDGTVRFWNACGEEVEYVRLGS
jgi:WD40 repeat protein